MKRFKNIHLLLVMLCLPFLMHAQVVRINGNANIIVTGDAKIVLHDGNLTQGSFGTSATPVIVTGYNENLLNESRGVPMTNNVLIDKSYGSLVSTDNTYIYLGSWQERVPGVVGMLAWPNPTTSRVTVTVQKDKASLETIALQDDHGRVLERRRVLLSPGVNTIQWSLDKYAIGSYVLVFENSPGKFLKIVKQ